MDLTLDERGDCCSAGGTYAENDEAVEDEEDTAENGLRGMRAALVGSVRWSESSSVVGGIDGRVYGKGCGGGTALNTLLTASAIARCSWSSL